MAEHFSDSQNAREALSALADGEAEAIDVARACAAWRDDAQAKKSWQAYHLIGDVMRSDDLAQASDGEDFLKAFRDRLAKEPVVLAPQSSPTVDASRQLDKTAPVHVLKRRSWAGPMAVAAGFVMVFGAVITSQFGAGAGADSRQVAQVAPLNRPQVIEAPVTDNGSIALASANLAGIPVQSGGGVSVEGASFSRPDPAAPVLIRDPQVDQLLASLPRHGNSAEASFASQGGMARTAAFELP